MLSIKNIIRGWYNFFVDLVSDIRYKKEFDERYEICKQCEDNRHGICKHCGCVLKAKTKAEDEACPIGKWKTIEDTLNG
jgi:hypothetical protein